jgi:hypothetical protein
VLQEIANTAIALVGVLVFGGAVPRIGNYPIDFACIQQTVDEIVEFDIPPRTYTLIA